MASRKALAYVALTALASVGCIDRKQGDVAAASVSEAGVDNAGVAAVDATGGEAGSLHVLDTLSVGLDGNTSTNDTADLLSATDDVVEELPDLAQRSETTSADTPNDLLVHLAPDLGPDKPLVADAAPDLGPDVPLNTDVPLDLPASSCVVGGSTYDSDSPNPSNACQSCKPSSSTTGWTNADDGTSCGTGRFCSAGTCKTGCFIAGRLYASDAPNPTNACQTCQTSFSTNAWTVAPNGTNCGSGQVCSGGSCQSGCWISGEFVNSGATNSSNPCQICKPSSATSAWSNTNDGTTCGAGKICGTGTCQLGCYLGGVVYPAGGLNPSNRCQSCNPSISTAAWYQVPSDCSLIAAHTGFTCASIGGTAKCWGNNASGNLGIGKTFAEVPSSSAPLTLSLLGTSVRAVATGSYSAHTCVLVGGGVQCWGWNNNGQLGNGTTTDSNIPVQVTGLTAGVRGVATGNWHSCALLSNQVQCWGYNFDGQLGAPTPQVNHTPVEVAALSGNIQSIALGGSHSCALVDSAVLCWGWNYYGQLGNGSTSDSQMPVAVSVAGTQVQAIAAGWGHTCALTSGGVLCWGRNESGQLGDGTTTDRFAPVAVQGLPSGVVSISGGSSYTCAVANGGAWCWGSNFSGQLGDNSTVDKWSPAAVQGLAAGVQAISAGYQHTCALVTGGAKCWGSNYSGELGDGSTSDSLTPVSVKGL